MLDLNKLIEDYTRIWPKSAGRQALTLDAVRFHAELLAKYVEGDDGDWDCLCDFTRVRMRDSYNICSYDLWDALVRNAEAARQWQWANYSPSNEANRYWEQYGRTPQRVLAATFLLFEINDALEEVGLAPVLLNIEIKEEA